VKEIVVALLFAAPLFAQRQSGSPLDHLPSNVEMITHFGERSDFSPDNRQIAFMDKSFGDAFSIDLATRQIRCLTCSIPGAVFLRVMHLSNGDYVLIGPEKFIDTRTSRGRDNELWYLNKKPGSKPVRFGIHLSEGAALSKTSMKIAYSELPAQFPEIPKDNSRIVVADIDLSDGSPRIINRKVIYESHTSGCILEAQDFYANDSKLTFTCYVRKDLPAHVEILANVMSINIQTGEVTNMTQHDGTYNEVEGIFPNGQYTCVEGDRQVAEIGGDHGMRNIDIWKLGLDGTGKNFVRLTHFNDYEGWKASNPVVSTDGKYMAFQAASTKDDAGVGYGILLYRLK
jgi:hypothetical protein